MSSHRGDTGCRTRGECWWVGRVGTRTTSTNLPNRQIQSSFLPNLLSRRDVDRALREAGGSLEPAMTCPGIRFAVLPA